MTTDFAIAVLFYSCTVVGLAQDQVPEKKPVPRASLSLIGEYRAVPLHTQPITSVPALRYNHIVNQDTRLNGAALGADLSLRLFREWIFAAYGLRVRYDHLFYEPSSGPGFQRSVNALTTDHLLMLRFQFDLNGDRGLYLELGHGFMNRGSDFTYSGAEQLPDGSYIEYTNSANFHFDSSIVGLGLRAERFEFGLKGYHNARPNELEPDSPYWVFAIHAGYRLTR